MGEYDTTSSLDVSLDAEIALDVERRIRVGLPVKQRRLATTGAADQVKLEALPRAPRRSMADLCPARKRSQSLVEWNLRICDLLLAEEGPSDIRPSNNPRPTISHHGTLEGLLLRKEPASPQKQSTSMGSLCSSIYLPGLLGPSLVYYQYYALFTGILI